MESGVEDVGIAVDVVKSEVEGDVVDSVDDVGVYVEPVGLTVVVVSNGAGVVVVGAVVVDVDWQIGS